MPQIRLEDENETLDWGNEEEESQQSSRRLYTGFNAGVGTIAGDDVEDTISLGDDEDEGFYSLSRNDGINPSASYNADQPASPPSSQSRSTTSGANHARLGHSPEPHMQGARVPVQEAPMSQETPHKKSTAPHSPQRSLPRLTHALPPKPVAASVTALTQPFPAVIAVTTITPISPRSAARDSKSMNGSAGKLAAPADLPQDWETRYSRQGDTYFYNRVTHESTWSFPTSTVVPSSVQEDSKTRRQRRSVSPSGNKTVAIESNTSCPRDVPRAGEPEIEEKKRPLSPDANGLTFEDRHYRPGLPSVVVSDEIRSFERSDISTGAGRHARSPSSRRRKPASPPGSELHTRIKEPPCDQRSVQEQPPTGTSKLDSYRDFDSRRWPPSPPPRSPTDYHGRSQREHAPYVSPEEHHMQVDPADYMQGPSFSRGDISRDRRRRSRDRDPPPTRTSGVRDPSASQNYFSAQRSRSPAPLPPSRERDRDIWDGKHEAREREYLEGARHSERERSRQYEHSHVPRSVQDYSSGRERPTNPDMDLPRGRNLERERVREGDRSERDRDVHHSRRETNTVVDADPRGQGDAKLKRNAEDYDRKAEELASARSRRAPLPPQQASFRSARLRDPPPPPPPIPVPSKRPEETPRAVAGVVGGVLPRQPRNSLSTVPSSSLELSRPLNGLEPRRFHGGPERQGRPHIRDSAPHLDKRVDAPRVERRQTGPTDRRLQEELQRTSNIPIDSGRRGSPRPRASTNDNGRRESNYDKPKDEKPREGSEREPTPLVERNNSRRGRDTPRQPARLTGTNNVPIGNKRPGVAGSDPEVGTLSTIPVRNLPPGKESYERPVDLPSSDLSRQPGPSSRTESGKNKSIHELRQPQARHDEARGRNPYPHPLAPGQQYSNGSNHRPLSPPPLSRDPSGFLLSSVPERLSTYPSSDGRSDISFRPTQNADPPGRSRGLYRGEPISRWDEPRRDPHRVSRQLSYSPVNLSPDEIDGAHSRHSSAGGDPLPPRTRKSITINTRFSSGGDPKALDRSDFLSRVGPPPLRRGGSLLDRLSLDQKDRGLLLDSHPVPGTSLRDRLVPSKRDRDEMMMNSEATSGREFEEKIQDFEGSDSKRARKRGGGKRRSGGRRI